MPGELFLSTNLIEPRLRNDYWREITRPLFDTRLPDGSNDATLEGSISSRLVGELLISRATFNPHRVCRDRRVILHSGLDDFYLLQLYPDTAFDADCDGRSMSAGPGDIGIFDFARAWQGQASSGTSLSIALPRKQIDKVTRGQDPHGLVLKATSPVIQVLADIIVSLYELPGDAASADALAIEEAAVALVAATLERRARDEVPADPVLSHILRRRVLEFIDARISEPNLGPDLLTRRFRVSRAHLYRMFAADGGIATVVRQRRLDAAYRELTRQGGSPYSITGIAHELGFSGSNQFLRAFRTRFGMTPSDVRREGSSFGAADQRLSSIQSHFAKYAEWHDREFSHALSTRSTQAKQISSP